MASLGRIIIQPRAVEFAILYGVDIEVLNSFSLEPGTIITEVTNMEQHKIVTGLLTIVNVPKSVFLMYPINQV